MIEAADQLPDDLETMRALYLAERAARIDAEALAVREQAERTHARALIARLQLEIEKLRREIHGSRSERKARLLDQMELQLEELEASATEDELASAKAARTSTVQGSNAGAPQGGHSPSTCRASVSLSPRRRAAPAAVRASWQSSGRTSPRRWK